MHIGDLHEANLGDGDGRKTEQFLARQHYFPVWGTCWESLAGEQLYVGTSYASADGVSAPQVEITFALGSRMELKLTQARGFWRECSVARRRCSA